MFAQPHSHEQDHLKPPFPSEALSTRSQITAAAIKPAASFLESLLVISVIGLLHFLSFALLFVGILLEFNIQWFY
nr:hypothetical protein Itr_chr05CG18540 [Ipomoea trifida]